MYKVVVSDIDGTLVDQNQQISEQNLKAIQQFQNEGGIFTIATGRVEQSVQPLITQLQIKYPVILYNGGKVMDYQLKRVIYERHISIQFALGFVKMALNNKLNICIYTNKGIYILNETDTIRTYTAKDKVIVQLLPSVAFLTSHIVYKILIIDEEACFQTCYNYFEKVPMSDVTIIQSENTYLEILPANVSKGEALKVLMDYLNLPIQSAIAIGDHFNDIEMIKAAGVGVAVNNAIPTLKEYADAIVPSNIEHGVAKTIYKYCLQREWEI